jgi:hypothetical protein
MSHRVLRYLLRGLEFHVYFYIDEGDLIKPSHGIPSPKRETGGKGGGFKKIPYSGK